MENATTPLVVLRGGALMAGFSASLGQNNYIDQPAVNNTLGSPLFHTISIGYRYKQKYCSIHPNQVLATYCISNRYTVLVYLPIYLYTVWTPSSGHRTVDVIFPSHKEQRIVEYFTLLAERTLID
jgi:hypothetical protein